MSLECLYEFCYLGNTITIGGREGSSAELRDWSGIACISEAVRCGIFRWSGHLERMEDTSCVRCVSMKVEEEVGVSKKWPWGRL